MLKITFQLGDGTVVTLECTEPERYSEIIASAQKYLAAPAISSPVWYDAGPEEALEKDAPAQEVPQSGATNGANRRLFEFQEFCRCLDPLPDMRRVVVAAEGARRYLGTGQVSPVELAKLFNWLQWAEPPSFLQTLRNAGRRNYRWMESVPGGSGYYVVTERGRRAVVRSDTEPD